MFFSLISKRGLFTSRVILKEIAPAEVDHHARGEKLWRNLTFFCGIPAVSLCALNAYLAHKKHHDDPRPEFRPYEHLRIRRKKFPWRDGNRSLFHNPHRNALPEGYET